jgi:Ring finger domain
MSAAHVPANVPSSHTVPVRITTMCLGRVCVGYRTAEYASPGPDVVAIISVFISVFIIVWAAMVAVLVVVELLRPTSGIATFQRNGVAQLQRLAHSQTRDKIIKEIIQRRSEVDDACPVAVQVGDCGRDDVCAVCLEAVECGALQRTLLCGHGFHAACIDRWVLQTSNGLYGMSPHCPMCKTVIARPPLRETEHSAGAETLSPAGGESV